MKYYSFLEHIITPPYTGVIVWNALPEHMQSSETFTKFRKWYIQITWREINTDNF